MGRILSHLTIFLSCLFIANAQVFDITKYGARPNGPEISKALLKAWGEACASPTASKVVIPKGIFTLKEAILKGPCKAPITLNVQGTVKAFPQPSSVKKNNEWIMIQYVDFFTMNGGGIFDGVGAKQAWPANKERCVTSDQCNRNPNNFALQFLRHSTVTNIISKNSKLFHFIMYGCDNVTFTKLTVDAPGDSPNTDGIHIGRSNHTIIQDSTFKSGDDCISIGDGCNGVLVKKVTCGPGHGISIGSLGKYAGEQPVTNVRVIDSKLSNTMNGVRIKTWANSQPGEVSDVHFENIEMTNVGNPIIIDQLYCPTGKCSMKPSKVKVSKVSFKGIRGTASTPDVVTLLCSSTFPCKGVEIGGIDLKFAGGPSTVNCKNTKPIFSGTQNPKIVCT